MYLLAWVSRDEEPSTSARKLRDQQLVALIGQIHASNYLMYGVRKIWYALKRHGSEVGHEQSQRLMRLAGVKRSPIPAQRWESPAALTITRIMCACSTMNVSRRLGLANRQAWWGVL
ncbi:IS3 family transposase [Arcanobacterium haemolyticum]